MNSIIIDALLAAAISLTVPVFYVITMLILKPSSRVMEKLRPQVTFLTGIAFCLVLGYRLLIL